MPIIISIEGNIGSGKSTLVTELYKNKSSINKQEKICFLQEPVDIWNSIKDKNNETILEKFYKDQQQYAFQFQMMAYISRLAQLREALCGDYDIIITERCMMTDKNVFAKMLYDDNKISEIEYNIYNKWFDEFIKDIPQIYIIYLKTSPFIAFNRIIERNRKGENIEIQYLESCHNYHESWINNEQKLNILKGKLEDINLNYILEIDGNQNFKEDGNIMKDWITKISQFITNNCLQ
tara:strand:- start:309 stop:1016 length:708 start_codon:yes stop_codon:yes gene_type:complete